MPLTEADQQIILQLVKQGIAEDRDQQQIKEAFRQDEAIQHQAALEHAQSQRNKRDIRNAIAYGVGVGVITAVSLFTAAPELRILYNGAFTGIAVSLGAITGATAGEPINRRASSVLRSVRGYLSFPRISAG